jgi:hypothetical protein
VPKKDFMASVTTPPGRIILPAQVRVLACRVFQPELTLLGLKEPQVIYLDQGLHIHPKSLRESIAQAIDDIEKDPEINQIILVYGYCGGGLEGIASQRASLVFPLVHDCIPLIKGGPVELSEGRMQHSFFLSAGWVDYGRTPLTEYLKYCDKFGPEDAMWVAKEMLKGYTSVTLIEHPDITRPEHHRHAAEIAELFDLKVKRTPADLKWLGELLQARSGDGVIVKTPGRPIELRLFLNAGPTSQVADQIEE